MKRKVIVQDKMSYKKVLLLPEYFDALLDKQDKDKANL